jgi:starch phosphorylase
MTKSPSADPSATLRRPTDLPRYITETEPVPIQIEDDRTGMSVETLKRAFLDNLYYLLAKDRRSATPLDYYLALAYTVRDRLLHRWIHTQRTYFEQDVRIVYYLSAEYLLGRQLGNNLINAGFYEKAQQFIAELKLGFDLRDLQEQEDEPGLGNGGLGRLAACFMDSLATLEIPAIGYGIRYEFGIFKQAVENGAQVEQPDRWLRYGNPWEIARPEYQVEVMFGGRTEHTTDEQGRYRVRWIPARRVVGIPYDTPVPGYGNNTCNTLRLWGARASEEFDFQVFNSGDYTRAVAEKTASENISKVLYPNDNSFQGKQLRLEQQYFFVACSLRDILRRYLRIHKDFSRFAERFVAKATIQINDTHPSIGIAELMRLLIDEQNMDWDDAWTITTRVFAFTNHTLLAEALERWPVSLFAALLPRHLEIIYEINRRFLAELAGHYPGDLARLRRMSLIEEGPEKYVRMAYLACVGSSAVNGVAALHTELLKTGLLKDFYELSPEKFVNVTNGITPRRWLLLANPKLALLYSRHIGKDWIADLEQLKALEERVGDPEFRAEWARIKLENKRDLACYIDHYNRITVDPHAIFDVQIKRFHEYKRQLLNCLHIVTLYNRLKRNPGLDLVPRAFIFGGKAAPGYFMAKRIIHLVNALADVVNDDPDVAGRLKVVFLVNYSVSVAQRTYPAADVSEQISTAGKEASGTSNMKFALNGALTVGTLDGANIEIRDRVGAENFFLFGLTAQEVEQIKAQGYNPRQFLDADPELQEAIGRISAGDFSGGDRELFRPLIDSLVYQDQYLLFADYRSYIACQEQVSAAYRDREHWLTMAIRNSIRVGYFSSDRSMRDYSRDIWHTRPVPIEVHAYDQMHGLDGLDGSDGHRETQGVRQPVF